MKLEEVLKKFTEDKRWNTENKDGSHRFDKKIEWIEQMVKEYAYFFKMSVDEVITIMEQHRDYSWPNYYQECNFPDIQKFDNLVGIYKTFKDFKQYAQEHWKGFKCLRCGDVGSHPQICEHRLNKDGKCDWCSFGLIQSEHKIIVLEDGFKTIPIFEPVER